jgi:putative phosphoesterase
MYWTVLSDTHGNRDAVYRILETEQKTEGFIHLGDLAADMELALSLTSRPVLLVAGNCDSGSHLPTELIAMLGRYRTLITHGHLFQVKGGIEGLASHALSCHCRVALYGHTHVAAIERRDSLLLINPGSLQKGATAPSYARIRLSATGPEAELVML